MPLMQLVLLILAAILGLVLVIGAGGRKAKANAAANA